MDAILVVNAGSSSLKFQIFAVAGDGARAAGARPDRRHRRAAAPARRRRRRRGAGRPQLSRRPRCPTCPPPSPRPARWLQTPRRLRAPRHRPPRRARRPGLRPAGADRRRRARPARRATRTLAPLHQPNNLAPIRLAHGDRPGGAAGRLLRHRLPPRPRRRTPTATPCRAPSTTRASAATASTACPTSTSPSGLREVAPEIAGGPRDRRPSRQRRLDVRAARRPQRREHDGLHRARRPADGHPAGPARSRRRALPDRAEGHERRGGHATCSTATPASRACPASPTTCATCSPATTRGAAFAIDHFVHRCALHAGHARGGARRPRRLRLHRRHRRELAPPIRARIAERLAWLGAELDPAANDAGAARISTPASRVALLVVPTDEELMIARHTLALVGA